MDITFPVCKELAEIENIPSVDDDIGLDPSYRQISSDQVVFDSVNSTGWIAMNSNIHLDPYIESTANIVIGSALGATDYIFVKEQANVDNNANISLNGVPLWPSLLVLLQFC